ncbi:NYN domain-containing protein [Sulfurovum sp. zt1-1]|uniref:NYN domain-containing protein n=1 Tax=Sulfurovum zhangzhouensis TaxID=3019067 RepID=A0ABT7QXL3_9BACT|nr:NYN domain-containing protein [Sulfurovum zhangzhouensis]MDM5271568.1 NYN domain-containing protein [Sulfurovum zhangzhouensis]
MASKNKDSHIALFIDSDNISHRALDGIINELSKYGVVNIRQAYGNWTKDNLKNWEAKLLELAIKPIQQFDYSKNKNATDILMTIDAMDLLHTKQIDAFAFATSDSDFTPVVMRVQAEGIKVYGFGEKKTPKPFMAACSQFIFTENLMSDAFSKSPTLEEKIQQPKRKTGDEMRKDSWLVNLLQNAVEQTMEDDGWANLADIGQYINNNSSFSPINYGYKKLSQLIDQIDLFDIYVDENSKQMSIRDKRYSS